MTTGLLPMLRTVGLTLLLAAALSACQTAQTPSGLTDRQVATLQANGFVRTGEGWELSLDDQLLFDFDSSIVKPDMQQRIQRISAALLAVGIDQARVEGHTDSVGSTEHNQRLSLSRAQSVAAVLSATGFQHERLAIRGWGALRPVADNGTELGRMENRRVVIIVTSL